MKRAFCAILLAAGLVLAAPAHAEEPNLEDGMAAYEKGDLAGVQWNLQPLADKGNVDAQRGFGLFYLDKMDPPDPDRAVKYLLPAAKQGDVEAQYRMAHLYMEGKGVMVDAQQMVTWLKAAAQQKHVDAMYEYGLLLLTGRYVVKDERLGLGYMGGAAAAGHVLAMNHLGIAYYMGDVKDVPRDLHTAAQWFTASSEKGLPAAFYMMAVLYMTDEGFGEVDLVKAYSWALLARNRTRDKAVRDAAGKVVNSIGVQIGSGRKRAGTKGFKLLDARIPRLNDQGKPAVEDEKGRDRDKDRDNGRPR